jgi:hypothetical protein
VQWLLLTAGDFAAGTFNTMAVGWAGKEAHETARIKFERLILNLL